MAIEARLRRFNSLHWNQYKQHFGNTASARASRFQIWPYQYISVVFLQADSRGQQMCCATATKNPINQDQRLPFSMKNQQADRPP
jgi:hypothetical protein